MLTKKNAFYGLIQSLGAWFGRVSEVMKKIGDHTSFFKSEKGLMSEFAMKNQGKIKNFQGIKGWLGN